LDDLEILEDIGRGSGGIVKKVRHKVTKKLMALKIIQLDVNTEVRKRILLELKTLYHAQSPHIVNFYGAFFTEGHIYICLVKFFSFFILFLFCLLISFSFSFSFSFFATGTHGCRIPS